MLELTNVVGTRMGSERMGLQEEDDNQSLVQGNKSHAHNVAHLDFLRNPDSRSVEVLCIDGYGLWDGGGVAVEFLKETLGF